MVRYAKPSLLDRIGNSHCVIEASAGTGKTYTLEHLVVQLIFDGMVPLENILVVTFTKKAALELKGRVRSKLVELVHLAEDKLHGPDPVWDLTPERRDRLRAAVTGFDRVTIATIHSFCQEVLKDAAFEGGHLFQQEQVASERAFDRAFTTLLRKDYATDQAGLLELALEFYGLGALRELLKNALGEGDCLELPDCPDVRSFLAGFPVQLAQNFLAGGDIRKPFPKANVRQITSRITETLSRLETSLASATPEQFWAQLGSWEKTFLKSLEVICLPGLEGDAARLSRALAETANFKAILVAALLPPLRAELRRAKAEEGLYDFDDMISLVAQALDGPQGGPLVGRLRERYQVALIDEFQDTDSQQWHIFSKIFLGSGAHRLIVVGDPKQAIFGFRGGDLPTYIAALASVAEQTGAEPLQLTINHRSTSEVIQSYNTIFDSAGVPSFFSEANARHYHQEVTCGKDYLRLTDAAGQALPALRLVDVVPSGSARKVKARTAAALAKAVKDTLDKAEFNAPKRAQPGLRPEDVFVLTNTLKEGKMVAGAFRARGIPASLYRQDGLFSGHEAEACRDILLAIESPMDDCRRAKALLGPFFGFSFLEAEEARDLSEGHPVLARLYRWQDLAKEGHHGAFFNALVSESGLSQRLLFLEENNRTLTNLLHILELLLQEALSRHCTLGDLAIQVQRWIDDLDQPKVEDGDTQRLERKGGSVQVLTRHKAKGLEAPVVALFGGTSGGKKDRPVHRYHLGPEGARRAWVGPVKTAPAEVRGWIRAEEAEEWERLEYVALTRAQAQLILPRYVSGTEDEPIPADGSFEQDGNPKVGPYRTVNLRLQAMAGAEGDPRRPGRIELIPAEKDPGPPAAGLDGSWTPVLPEAIEGSPDFQALRGKGRPVWVFNYTGLKDGLARKAGAGSREEEVKEDLVPGGPSGSRRFGVQVHACLQKADPSSFQGRDLEAWLALPDTQRLADACLPREGRRDALAWVYAAMALPLPLPGGGEAVLSRSEELLRELDFLTPYPERADFLDGSIDMLFKWEGRAFLLDWKTDRLAGYDLPHVDQAVQGHYLLQVKIYTITACRFLGIRDAAHYERAFGGVVYVFLRGLPGGGVWNLRPSWETVQAWERELDALTPEQFIPVHAGGQSNA